VNLTREEGPWFGRAGLGPIRGSRPSRWPGSAPGTGPDVRRRLLEEAARLLGEEGPAALTTRRLAREAGTSTMAVCTHFGGMPALVRRSWPRASAGWWRGWRRCR
jgi:hypothetical protein